MSGKNSNRGIIQTILTKRGIPLEEQERFIHPDFLKDQPDGALLLGMKKAVARLSTAIQKSEKIVIFGDYDADGVPATALLVRCLRALNIEPTPLVPTRARGYGLSAASVEEIKELQAQVLITVDNGTVAKAEIAELAAAGIDVIVVDHHEPQEGEIAEAAFAIINPKQKNCPYPFKELCGCGLAWKLMDQLYASLQKDRAQLKWELDLVALSTIADMVPLLGENRLLTLYGLKVLRKSHNLGLQALAQQAGIQLEVCTTTDVSYRLAPRINAPSRMHQEMVEGKNAALQLLVTTNKAEAARMAAHLHSQNTDRQQLVDSHLAEAEQQAEQYQEMLCLVVFHEEWSSGIIGLVAGRLMERYKRPVVALAREGEEIKGSVRTGEAVHALDLISAAAPLLSRFGGHARAAGLSLVGEVDELRAALQNWLHAQGHTLVELIEAAEKQAEIDIEIDDINLELINDLEALEPFGVGFPAPLFCSPCELTAIRLVGSSKQHFSAFLTKNGVQKKGIAFGQADRSPLANTPYMVCYTLGKETWQGVTAPVCFIQNFVSRQ